ncbi:MAG: hypothetical protein ACRD2E_02695 [Terriglobales bacterium]
MAFVRKKGKSYYLVHNVREDGRVRQVHLACLGNRPRVTDEIVQQVRQAHPGIEIDWSAVRQRATESFASPFADPEGVRQLARALRSLNMDINELDWEVASRHAGAELSELTQEMRALRSSLDAQLTAWTGRAPSSAPASRSWEEERKVEG